MPKKRGRPTKLTPEVAETLIKLVGIGTLVTSQATFIGVNPDTIWTWLRDGENARNRAESRDLSEHDAFLADFWSRYKRAEAAWKIDAIQKIQRYGGVRGLMWLLERRFPNKWGSRRCGKTHADAHDNAPEFCEDAPSVRELEEEKARALITQRLSESLIQ